MKRLMILTVTFALMFTGSFAQQEPSEVLKLKIRDESTSWEKISQGRKAKDTDYSLQYTILTNQPLSDIRLEYCIYRDKIIAGDEFVEVDPRATRIREINPGKRETIKLGGGRSFKSSDSGFLNEISGCRVRAYITKSDGTEVVQEAQHPNRLELDKYPWNTPPDQSAAQKNTPETGKLFIDETKLVITPYMTETKWDDDDETVANRESKRTCFRLRLENTTAINFTGIRAEFCTFRDRLNSKGTYIASEISTNDVGVLVANEWKNVVRPGIPISFRVGEEFLNEVLGARVRVYLPLADGQELVREIKLPKSLSDDKFPWGETDEK